MTKDQSEGSPTSIVSIFLSDLTIFSIILVLIYVIFLYFVMVQWSIVQSFFMFFDNCSPLVVTIKGFIGSVLVNPTIEIISIFIVIGTIFCHLAQRIKIEGHVFFENDGLLGKYFQSLFTTLNLISFIMIPIFSYFLILKQSYLELGLIVVVIILNYVLSLKILTNWVRITNTYEDMVNFKSSNSIVKQSRDLIAGAMIFLIVLSSLYFLFLTDFNLISMVFFEISFFIAYFIFCSVTHNIEGPLNIFLIDGETLFREAYIFEDSPYKNYLFVVLRNDIQKKIMKSSILYMEHSKVE